jgi:hypothetical protein
MTKHPAGENGNSRRPPDRGERDRRRQPSSGPGSGSRGRTTPDGSRQKRGPIGLCRLKGEDFELVHPRGVNEVELDYEEGIEIWKAGDPEGARDALRYALSACHDNLWVHVALGQIALKEFRDPTLARGHFGYAFELGRRALPQGFLGRLAPDRANNRPFYEALDGLISCLEALGQTHECTPLRALRDRLSSGGS